MKVSFFAPKFAQRETLPTEKNCYGAGNNIIKNNNEKELFDNPVRRINDDASKIIGVSR